MAEEKTLKNLTEEELISLAKQDRLLCNALFDTKELYKSLALKSHGSDRSHVIHAACHLMDKVVCLLHSCPEHSSRALLASLVCTDKYGNNLPELNSFDEMTEFLDPKNVERLLSGITAS